MCGSSLGTAYRLVGGKHHAEHSPRPARRKDARRKHAITCANIASTRLKTTAFMMPPNAVHLRRALTNTSAVDIYFDRIRPLR